MYQLHSDIIDALIHVLIRFNQSSQERVPT